MAAIGKYLKEKDPRARVVFIGPCTAKKMEFQRPEVHPYVDAVLTFEELQALFDSRDIDLLSLDETALVDASGFGRSFAHSGGLTGALRQALAEQGKDDFDFKPVACDGIDACRVALLKASKNLLEGNFIEGMACEGGCIGGAGCLTHTARNKADVDRHAAAAVKKTLEESLAAL
ncbi:hypothetical protein SDC9_143817 [bioreactor metagenome]|uniref:Iron hydrogenase large subunit C-terminal domain-containing protein n=1 Tax=bioreactor metagenome TaxID=1076179 RepID=A0A645E7Q7_9ZZZZ